MPPGLLVAHAHARGIRQYGVAGGADAAARGVRRSRVMRAVAVQESRQVVPRVRSSPTPGSGKRRERRRQAVEQRRLQQRPRARYAIWRDASFCHRNIPR